MRKIYFSLLAFLLSLSLFAQDPGGARAKVAKKRSLAFTENHRSISLTYGLSTLFNVAPFIKSNTGIDNSGSFAVGPVSALYNAALTKHISIQFGTSVLFYRDKYYYENAAVKTGKSDLLLLGINTGFNYHFATTRVLDPYIGVAGGVGYFTSSRGADQASLRLKGEVPVLYSAKVGINVSNKRKDAWAFELGYDYLSYFKVGYTFVKYR